MKMQKMQKKRRPLDIDRNVTTPNRFQRTYRGDRLNVLTSMPAGRMVPVAYAPILREDAVRQGRTRLTFEMHETAEMLMNAVLVKASAYFVPWLAMERFNGSMDQLDRSYNGQPPMAGDPVVPFFETEARGAIPASQADYGVLEYLGIHEDPAAEINTMPIEAYNLIWNMRAENRSPQITQRTRLDRTLAPAFWSHHAFKHIVPDFDQLSVDGSVALTVTNAQMPVSGIGVHASNTTGSTVTVNETAGQTAFTHAHLPGAGASPGVYIEAQGLNGLPAIYAELQQNGISVSLANIELAKKTRAYAKMREKYTELSEDYIIDMLMQGLSVPHQHLKQPILLQQKETVFGMAKRYASDAANLSESVVNGATYVDMNLSMPQINTGGLIMIVAECLPDQLFERQQDSFVSLSTVAELPDALRDDLDPEKVDVVTNDYLDVDHNAPTTVAGYEPLNAKWDRKLTRIGGRFYRPAVDGTYDQDRERIWAMEVANPTLTEQFYISTDVNIDPFVDQTQDPFECVVQGGLIIEGLTQFGPALIEASDNYQQVLDEAPTTTITK